MENIGTNTTALMTLVTTVMGIFSEFPLNIILVGSLAGVAFKLFGKAKRTAN